MYAKLVFRNAKRSVKDYLVYIVTMTICVTLFYAFLSISSSYYSPDIGNEYDFTLLSDGMKIAICMITLLLLFLIRFRFLYKGIIIKHNKTEPTYTKTSLFLCEKRRFFMARTEKGVVTTI